MEEMNIGQVCGGYVTGFYDPDRSSSSGMCMANVPVLIGVVVLFTSGNQRGTGMTGRSL
jgi:hypothetical protein